MAPPQPPDVRLLGQGGARTTHDLRPLCEVGRTLSADWRHPRAPLRVCHTRDTSRSTVLPSRLPTCEGAAGTQQVHVPPASRSSANADRPTAGISSGHRPPSSARCRPWPAAGWTGRRADSLRRFLPRGRPASKQGYALSASSPAMHAAPFSCAGPLPVAGARRVPDQAGVTPKDRAAWRRASSVAGSRLSTKVPG